jgi:hypothetical protein
MNIEQITTALKDAGFTVSNHRWRKLVEGRGLPLTHDEQEMNRRGGKDYGPADYATSRAILVDALEYAEYAADEYGETWRKDWISQARAALAAS